MVMSLATQTPLLYWPMNEQVNDGTVPDVIADIDNLDALLGEGNFVNSANLGAAIVVGGTSLRPSAGFDGFDETNTAFKLQHKLFRQRNGRADLPTKLGRHDSRCGIHVGQCDES